MGCGVIIGLSVEEGGADGFGAVGVVVVVAAEEVGEEEQFEHEEYDEEFYQYQQPQFPADGHGAEAFEVEADYLSGPCRKA